MTEEGMFNNRNPHSLPPSMFFCQEPYREERTSDGLRLVFTSRAGMGRNARAVAHFTPDQDSHSRRRPEILQTSLQLTDDEEG